MPNKRQTGDKLGLLDTLRAAIEADERSLRQIATEADTTASSLSRFCRGERTLSADVLDKLASVLGIVVKPPRKRPQK